MKTMRALKSWVEAILGRSGISVYFVRKKNKCDIVLFDKNTLSAFYNKSKRVELYHEGLRRVKGEWSDNFYKQCRFYSLQEMAEWVMAKELHGDFAECGCWKGHSSYIISKILSANSFKGEFHIFDSFEYGLSDKSLEDKNERAELTKEEIAREKLLFGSTEEEVRRALSDFPFARLYKGWIPERFKDVERRKFSFVHIDVDLYQPTMDSLNFFFPRLVSGGCIVIDDYGITQFPGPRKAIDAFLLQNRCFLFYELPTGGCFIIK